MFCLIFKIILIIPPPPPPLPAPNTCCHRRRHSVWMLSSHRHCHDNESLFGIKMYTLLVLCCLVSTVTSWLRIDEYWIWWIRINVSCIQRICTFVVKTCSKLKLKWGRHFAILKNVWQTVFNTIMHGKHLAALCNVWQTWLYYNAWHTLWNTRIYGRHFGIVSGGH